MTRVVRADYRFRDVIQVGHDSSRDLLLAVADRRGVAFGVASFDPDSGDASIVAHRPVDPPLRMPDTVVAWRGGPSPPRRAAIAAVREVARQLYETSRGVDPDARRLDAHHADIGQDRPAAV
jgi:hypothetical protein